MLKKLFGLFGQQDGYKSPMGNLLKDFDQKRPQKSDSQLREIAKHDRVFRLRDHAARENAKNKLWEGF